MWKFWLTHRRVLAFGAVAAVAVAAVGTAVAAFPQDNVKLYTGCLTSGGSLIYVAEGDNPLQPCGSPKQVVKLSGGDITSLTVTAPLTGGGTNGALTIGLDGSATLPSCSTNNAVPKWNLATSRWTCGIDNDHTYTADGTTLNLSGNEFSIASGYRVQNNQSCDSGKFASGIDSSGSLACGTPSAGTRVFAALESPSGGIGIPDDGIYHQVVTLAVGSGTYAVTAIGRLADEANSDAAMECELRSDSAVLSRGRAVAIEDVSNGTSMAIFGLANVSSSATLSVWCETGSDGVSARGFGIQAITVS